MEADLSQLSFDVGASNIDRVTEALDGRSSSLSHISLYFYGSFFSLPHSDMRSFMEAISSMPNVESLLVGVSQTIYDEGHCLPVAVLQGAMNPNLKSLGLFKLRLVGSHSEFESFAETLRRSLTKLEYVMLSKVGSQAVSPQEPLYPMLDSIVHALAQMPKLNHVRITGHRNVALSPSTFEELFAGSASLGELHLHDMVLNTSHLTAMGQAPAAHAGKLCHLCLQCHLTVDGAHALVRVLQAQKALRKLNLHLTDDKDDPGGMELSAMNTGAAKQGTQVLRNTVLAQGITNSNELSIFVLENVNLSTSQLREPFRQMLQNNYTLGAVRLQCSTDKSHGLDEEITFYTHLNRLGRGHLFECESCSQCDIAYLEFLMDLNKEDEELGVLYYFLRCKPSLVSRAVKPSGASSRMGLMVGKRKRLYRAVKYNIKSYKWV